MTVIYSIITSSGAQLCSGSFLHRIQSTIFRGTLRICIFLHLLILFYFSLSLKCPNRLRNPVNTLHNQHWNNNYVSTRICRLPSYESDTGRSSEPIPLPDSHYFVPPWRIGHLPLLWIWRTHIPTSKWPENPISRYHLLTCSFSGSSVGQNSSKFHLHSLFRSKLFSVFQIILPLIFFIL